MTKTLSSLRNPHIGLSKRDKTVVIREATEEDISQIVSISQTTNSFRMSKFTDEIDEEELRFWISDPRSIVIVTVFDSILLGYAYGFCLSPKWFFFDAFLVASQVRRTGIGKKMYAYLRETCRLRGLQLIQGLIKKSEPKALKYWTARGFHRGSKCVWVEDWLYKD